jgi:hypothetical protein
MKKEEFKGGWVCQQPDHRDFRFDDVRKAIMLPASIDLRSQIKRVNDQDGVGCCVGEGCGACFAACQVRLTGSDFPSCIKYEYRNARILSGTFPGDNGADVRSGVKATAQYGVCPESDWPFDTNIDATPPTKCATDAAKAESTNYYLLDSTSGTSQTLINIKTALAGGLCVVFGSTVYESIFNVGSDGMIPYPTSGDPVAGGHCMLWVGYDDAKQCFLTLNSWGTGWGMNGFGWLPYKYVTAGLANDCWAIAAESEINPNPTPTPTPTTVTTKSEMFPVVSATDTHKFVVGSDNAVWWKLNTNKWQSLGGVAYAGKMPTAAVINGVLTVFIEGTDQAQYMKQYVNGAWTAKWQNVEHQLQ